jgi:hypothetical protein
MEAGVRRLAGGAAIFLFLTALARAGWAGASPPVSPAAHRVTVVRPDAGTTITLAVIQNAGACNLVSTGSNFAAVDLGNGNKTSATSCATYAAGNTYTLTTSFSVQATCAGTCTNWNLTAALATAAQTNISWKLGTKTLTTTAQAITSTIAYPTVQSEAFVLTVKTTGGTTPNTVSQAIVLTATANGVAGVNATATLNAQFINQPGIAIYLVSDPSGVPLTGGAFNAGVNFGAVSAYAPLSPGVTLVTVTGTNFTVQTPVDIKVENSGVVSASYTLSASLGAVVATGITYVLNGVALTTTAQTVQSAGTYNAAQAYPLGLRLLTAAPGSGGPATGSPISNTINVTAVSN